MILRGFGKREDRDTVGSPVSGSPRFVFARIRVKHPAASHHVRDHVKVPAKVRIAEIRKNRAITMNLLYEAGESLFRDSNQETFA